MKRNPAKARDTAKVAQTLAADGDNRAAIRKYEEACELNSDVAAWHAHLARLFDQEGDLYSAIAANARALRLKPNVRAEWYAHKGSLLVRIERLKGAITAYQTAVSIDDSVAHWHAVLADLFQKSEHLKDAIERYECAIDLDKTQPYWRAELKRIVQLVDQVNVSPEVWRTKQKDARWYDIIYEGNSEYAKCYYESVYFPVWYKVIQLLKSKGLSEILEVACGSGQLAQAIQEHLQPARYLGCDFSRSAIEIAKRNSPPSEFIVANAFDRDIYTQTKFDCVISTEFLEHVENDLEIFSLIPEGTCFIGTVPSFDSVSHVRYFDSLQEVRERYEPSLGNYNIESVGIKGGRLFLFSGNVR